jgi:hypothetical protein
VSVDHDGARSRLAHAMSVESSRVMTESARKLDEALDGCSNGVPIRPINGEDSLAVLMENVETAASEQVVQLRSSRSRRAARR